jgi:hypothetical protein
MFRVLVLPTVFVAALIPWFWTRQRTHPAIPVRFSQDHYSAGTTKPGEAVTVEVGLRNDSNEPVSFVSARTTCRCADFPKEILGKVIDPGEELALSVEIKSHQADAGIITAGILGQLRADSGVTYVCDCQVVVDVLPDFETTPRTLGFASTSHNELANEVLTLRLVERDKEDLAVTSCQTTSPHFEVAEIRDLKDRIEIDVRFKPDNEYDHTFVGMLRVSTNSEYTPVVEVPISAEVRDSIHVSPDRICFLEHEFEKSVVIKSDQRFCVTNVECDARFFRAEFSASGDFAHRQEVLLICVEKSEVSARDILVVETIDEVGNRRSFSIQMFQLASERR